MNSKDEKQQKEEPPPPRDREFKDLLEQYAAHLRAFMEKLRRKLN